MSELVSNLVKLADQLDKEGYTIEADTLDIVINRIAKKDKGKSTKCKEKYQSEEGHFKGKAGSGERFKNCIKYQKCMGKNEEQAEKICGAIKKKKYGGFDDEIKTAELTEEQKKAREEYQADMPGYQTDEEVEEKLKVKEKAESKPQIISLAEMIDICPACAHQMIDNGETYIEL